MENPKRGRYRSRRHREYIGGWVSEQVADFLRAFKRDQSYGWAIEELSRQMQESKPATTSLPKKL